MKQIVLITALLSVYSLCAQLDTDVYVLDFNLTNRTVGEPLNISDNDGYDNQPYFANDSLIFYARTRDNQTDIAAYDLALNMTSWKSTTNYGSEYSPIQIPNNTEIAAVRLDTTGLQRLYLYNESETFIQPLHDNLVVGYHAWRNAKEVILFVLGAPNTLMHLNTALIETKTIASNIGRSLHKVPHSELMSYTSINSNGIHEVYLLDIDDNFSSYYVCDLPLGIQDYTWINRDVLLIGSGSTLYTYDTFVDEDWQEFADLSAFDIKNISRLDISPSTKKLVLVAE